MAESGHATDREVRHAPRTLVVAHGAADTLSIARARTPIGGRSVETPVKTRSSRRSIDLDPATENTLKRWRRQQHGDGHPVALETRSSPNPEGSPLHAETISQLFARQTGRLDMHPIRFHTSATPTPPCSNTCRQ